MKCCLCQKEIEVIGMYKDGHNAWPLNKEIRDRCCGDCNATKVIPARLAMAYKKETK